MTQTDLRALLAEKKRREIINRVYTFNPHKKQEEAIRLFDDYDEILILGGNRTGKTEIGAVLFSRYLLQEKRIGWSLCPSFSSQKDTTQKKLSYYLPQELTKREYYHIHGVLAEKELKNQSRFIFHSYEQGREKLQGTGLDIIWFDEEPPRDIYLECKMRQEAGQKLKIIMTLTPFLSQEFIKEKSNLTSCVKMCWADNTYLTEDQKAMMREGLSENELAVREFGNFVVLEGRVIRNLPSTEDFELDDSYDFWECIDPGFADPTGYIFLGINTVGEVFVDRVFRKTQMSYEDIEKEVKNQRSGRKIYRTLSDNNEPRLINELSTHGIYATPIKKTAKIGSWDEYLALKASYFFDKNKIHFSRRCMPLIDELVNLYWKKNGEQTLPEFDLHRRLGHHFDLSIALFYLLSEIHEKYVEQKTRERLALLEDTFHEEISYNNFSYTQQE